MAIGLCFYIWTAADDAAAGPAKKKDDTADIPLHQCDQCGNTYKTRKSLISHRDCMHGEGKKQKCPILQSWISFCYPPFVNLLHPDEDQGFSSPTPPSLSSRLQ